MNDRCTICGTTVGLTWCGTCKRWLCPDCKNRWDKRAVAAVTQGLGSILQRAGLR